MRRIVESEILDHLPPEDPRAVRSRRDLRRINWFMRNIPLLARTIGNSVQRPLQRVADIGTGDGTPALALARRLGWKGVHIQLVDRQPVVNAETLQQFREAGCEPEVIASDLRNWIRSAPQYDLILANLFLHHFQDNELRLFFKEFAQITQTFASCDPRRWRPALVATRLLWALGCSNITRHDAEVSVRAGFRDKELTKLWPDDNGWSLNEVPGGYASHLFFAKRV